MARWNIGLFSKWVGVGENRMAVADTYAGAWTDVGQQDDTAIVTKKAVAYCTLVLGEVDDATLAAIQADSHYLILVRWEITAPGVNPSFDNRLNTVTSNQRDAFVAYFLAEFGISVAKIPVIQNSVGRTRIAVLRDIVQNIREL